jgi:rod shape-determining protein MreD
MIIAFFILETSLFPWLIPEQYRFYIFPKLVIIAIIYLSIFTNRHYGLMFGLGFGLLQDVHYYGHMIGPNAFSFALIGYISGLLIRSSSAHFITIMFIQSLSLFLNEIIVYFLYRLFNITVMDFGWMFIRSMLPSVMISMFLALAIYIPARSILEKMDFKRGSEETKVRNL